MSQKPSGNGYGQMLSWLREAAQDADAEWQELVDQIGRGRKNKSIEERHEELVRALKAMRDAGVIARDDALSMIGRSLIAIAEHRIVTQPTPTLDKVSQQMGAVEQAHGLADDESWTVGEGPPEWEELQ